MEPRAIAHGSVGHVGYPASDQWIRGGVRPLAIDGRAQARARRIRRVICCLGLALVIAVPAAAAALPKLTPLRLYSVNSGSMVPTLPVGSITIVNTSQRAPHVGAVMAFMPPMLAGSIYVHRVIRVFPDGAFKTEGDALRTPDPWTVKAGQGIGTVVRVLPYANYVLILTKVLALIALIGAILRWLLRRVYWRPLGGGTITAGSVAGALFYLLWKLKPLVGGSAAFVSISHHAARVDLVNTGLLPFRAFSAANPKDVAMSVAPNSVATATFHVGAHASISSIANVRVVPAPTPTDLAVLALVALTPTLIIAFSSLAKRGPIVLRVPEVRSAAQSAGDQPALVLLHAWGQPA